MSDDLDSEIRQQFTGNFVDANDIRNHAPVEVEIESVTAPGKERDAAGKMIDKTVIRFRGKKKAFICNKTNLRIIAAQHGDSAKAWAGKKIKLTVRYLEKAFGHRNVPVVRVLPASDSLMTFGMRQKYGAAKPFDIAEPQ